MSGDSLFKTDDAATPLTEEEKQGLIPSYIALRAELNEAEQMNILEGEKWALSRRRKVLDEHFLKRLHKEMFKNVWKWAGTYRTTPRNIGIDAYRIGTELNQLLSDIRYWIDHTTYPPDEIAMRFHHRLVFIHPFPNGNGRHARLAADLLALQQEQPRFTWGREMIGAVGSEVRTRYVSALRAADRHDIQPLLAFARA